MKTRDVRLFGLMWLVVAAIAAFRLSRHAALVSAICTTVGVFALIAPRASLPLYRAWMALGHALGRITTPIIMAVIYFGVMTPMRLLLLLVRKEVLPMGREPSAPSYWVERKVRRFERADFERLG